MADTTSRSATRTSATSAKGGPAAQVPAWRRWRLSWGRQMPLVFGFVLLLAVAALSVFLSIAGHHFNASVAHTLQVRSGAYRLLTFVQDAETGQRGYLLTGNRAYLQPYLEGTAQIPAAIAALEELTAGNPVQSATVASLKQSIDAKLKELANTVALVENNDAAGALARVKQNIGNRLMQAIRVDVDRLEAEEERNQAIQSDASETNGLLQAVLTVAGIVIVIGLATVVLLASRRATSDLLRAQDALRGTNENLEGLVAERVSELQIANEEIQRFAYIVSHDLRAPLVNVMGFTSELDAVRDDLLAFLKDVETRAPELVTPSRKMAVATDLPEALGFIRTSTAKMDRLINAILKLSREGRRVLTPQKIDLRELILAQGESLAQQLAVGSTELTVNEDLPGLVSDRLAIEQIFGNLIENASKYLSPDRPGRITVSGKAQGAYLRYDVADNGRGIEAKDFERVFELFRRSGEQDKPGEGIGLAYVRNLARRLGGNVTVQSEFGKGSTFTVILPAVYSSKTKAAR